MIQEITKITNPATLEELKSFPNQGVIWEILERNKSGKIFILSDGTILILENCSDPFVFMAGNITAQSIEEAINLVGSRAFPMIYCNPKYHSLFLDKGWDFHVRVELQLVNFSNLQKAEAPLIVKPIDTIELFQKCFWYKEVCELDGSAENFLTFGTGYALCLEDRVLSEAYASVGGGYAEIGVVTHPEERGKGYASQVLSVLIKKCEESKIIPIWSCSINNLASLHTGLKQGFVISRYYVQMVPEVGNVLGPKLVNWLKNNEYSC